jgi:hypothetical protein
MRGENHEDSVITTGGLTKIVGAILLIIAYTVAVYAWIESIDRKYALLAQEFSLFRLTTNKQLEHLAAQGEAQRAATEQLNLTIARTNNLLESMKGRP